MLKLTEEAACKYGFARDHCNTKIVSDSKEEKFLEISLMGISDENDLTLVKDWYIPKQEVTTSTTDFDDEGWAETVDRIRFGYLDDHPGDNEGAQREVDRYTKVWAHTHPMPSPKPSGTDEETFKEFFDDEHVSFGCMLILGEKNETSNRMKYQSQIGPKISEEPVVVVKENGDQIPLKLYIDAMDSAKKMVKDARALGFQISISDNAQFPDYSHKHEEWLKEIKDNVTKKEYSSNHNSGTTNDNYHRSGQSAKTVSDKEVDALLVQKASIWIAE